MARSKLPRFYSLSVEDRLNTLENTSTLSANDIRLLKRGDRTLGMEMVDIWIENAVSIFGLPYGVATNLHINGRDVLVPMVVEESSVLAAASFAGKLVRNTGGFQSEVLGNEMIGQIHFPRLVDAKKFLRDVDQIRSSLLESARSIVPRLVMRGGGINDLYVRVLADNSVTIQLLIDPCDAMGANIVNTICESVALEIEQRLHVKAGIKILSNLSDKRLVHTGCRIAIKDLRSDSYKSEELAKRIVDASDFAFYDPYRACTHNKGIMNGVDPVVIATGNDWRAVEAGAHAYAARDGQYRGLSRWWLEEDFLCGELTMPLALGIVGGVTRQHPMAELSLRLMEIKTVRELCEIVVSVGLAQNFSALRALAAEGIQHGHMRLHAKNIAISAGAKPEEVHKIVEKLIQRGGRDLASSGVLDRASSIIDELRLS